jgi:hypothetical protein
LDVKSGTGPRLDIQLCPQVRVPTSPALFGAAVLHPGTKTCQVESRAGDEVGTRVGMEKEMSETPF